MKPGCQAVVPVMEQSILDPRGQVTIPAWTPVLVVCHCEIYIQHYNCDATAVHSTELVATSTRAFQVIVHFYNG